MFIVVCGLEHLVDLTKRSLVCYRPLAVFLESWAVEDAF